MEFRDMLVKARKEKGYNQEELAERIGVSRQAVSKWETGDAQPALSQLIALADALDISLDVLCGRTSSDSSDTADNPVPSPDPTAATDAPASDSSAEVTADLQTRSNDGSGHPADRSISLTVAFLPLLLAVLIVAGMFFHMSSTIAASEEAAAKNQLPDTIEVTGVYFYGADTDNSVDFEFTPSIVNPDLNYTLTFYGFDRVPHSFPVESDHGAFHGTAKLPSGGYAYTVTLEISDGTDSRAVALASNLTFNKSNASWNPLTDQ